MASSRDWKAGGEEPPSDVPKLPPHMDPRRPRGGVPARPRRSVPPRPPAAERKVPGEPRVPVRRPLGPTPSGQRIPGGPTARAGRPPGAPTPPASRPPGGPAPASRPVLPAAAPRRRSRGARVLSWIAVLTSFAVLASASAGWALLNFYDGKINRISGLGLDSDRPQDLPRDAKNILIVGSDTRGDAKPGENFQGAGDEFVAGQRADTIILAHLYGDTDAAQLISFPRDSWVTIPEHTDPETGEIVPAREGKLNIAIQDGGPSLLIDTVEELSGLHVDHYMQVDFDGFQAIVNKLDGVEVCLPKAAKEKDSGIDLPAGRSVVKGDQALAFVRQRKGLPNGDIDRIRRQQQFIGAIVRKVLSAGTLLNPVKVNGVITVATESLEVDEDLQIDDLQQLALRMRGFDAGGVVFTTVPVAQINGVRRGQSVVLLDEVKAEQLFEQVRQDVPPNLPAKEKPGQAPGEPLIVAPGSIRVKVLNGAGVEGLGRRAAEDLERVGFQLVGMPGNRGSTEVGTVVLHGPDRADSARTLSAAIPGSTTRLEPSLTRTLEVVVGASYAGTQPVTVTGAPKPPPPPAGAPPPVLTAAQDPCAA